MERVLLIGNGGREHAIAWAIKRSNVQNELYSLMGARNPGIAKLCKEFFIGDALNAATVAKFALSKRIDLAVVGPEAPLDAGVVDELLRNGVECASPTRSAARMETDKGFARELLGKYKVKGSPAFGVFTDLREASDFIDSFGKPVVVKPAGLTGGKGVKIVGEQLRDSNDAKEYAKEILAEGVGGIRKVVVEERLDGEEFSLQAFVDGRRVVGTPMVQDHKRAYANDQGMNTGGMGAYSDAGYILPFLKQDDYDEGISIMKASVEAFRKETGEDYKGFLYGGFIVTAEGVKLLEFNARLGDPEAMNTLSVIKSDFLNILERVVDGNLKDAGFYRKATVCKYLVPEGYPVSPKQNEPIEVDEKAIESSGAVLYYASVNQKDGRIYTGSSRTAGLVGIAENIEKAERIAESAIGFVKGKLFYRKDIGTRELIQKRMDHMKKLRGHL
ncbi:MAG: Phosphoribosylamine--glycine ligase [Candidatus Fermentimicrarchaeum limneticum]|uniref:Phosphoribosylamine--glycine ligase n=1 Tax=Fermentimicrarchaeum limneticum TaxID=2795018 RepID=A0A7D5XEE5_FERL1|nr:MAG: Phosphoribosylamine--glycine ligase [Candidatus Fermentimicrarchaeum limneticum]